MKKYLLYILLLSFSCKTIDTKEVIWLKPGMLNSARIEDKFGSYGVSPLVNDMERGLRLANLHSKDGEQQVMRTLALVNFAKKIEQELSVAHQEILNGASLGSTLVRYGAKVNKTVIYKNSFDNLPQKIYNLMNISKRKLPVFIYDLSAEINNKNIYYCTITEVYSDEFLNMDELNIINNSLPQIENYERALQNISLLKELLER